MTPSSSSHVDFSRFPLLSKPLYAFSLPPELLDILTLRSLAGLPAPTDLDPNKNSDDDNDDDDQSRDSLSKPGDGSAAGGSLTCQTCLGTTFSTVQEQRSHFKSDWHRYNTRVTQSKTFSGGGRGAGKGLGVLTEVEFEEIDDGEFVSIDLLMWSFSSGQLINTPTWTHSASLLPLTSGL